MPGTISSGYGPPARPSWRRAPSRPLRGPALFEFAKSLIVLAAGGVLVYLFFLGIYRNLRWRFPRLSPLWFSAGAVALTVAAGTMMVRFSSDPQVSCGMTEIAIFRSMDGNPLEKAVGAERDGPMDAEAAAKFCRIYWRDCPAWQSEHADRIERICTEVTAFDAVR